MDISSEQAPAQVSEVFRVLAEIGAAKTPQILVLNKCDLLEGEPLPAALLGSRLLEGAGQDTQTPVVMASGRTGQGVEDVLRQIDEVLQFDPVEPVRFRIPMRDGASIALLHARGRVKAENYQGNICEVDVDAPASLRSLLSRYLVRGSPSSNQ